MVGHLFFEFLPPTQTFVRNLLAAHARYEPRILTRSLVDPAGFPSERIVELGLREDRWPARLGHAVLRRTGRWRGPLDRELLAAAGDCRVLHAHFGPTGSRAALAAGRLGIPLVTSFYGWDLALPGSAGGPREEYRRLFASGAAFICEGPAMAEQLASIGCRRELIEVVPIAIDPAEFPFEPRLPRADLKLIQTGRLIPKKGVDVSLRAFAAAEGVRRGWTLQIVGDGPERQGLETLAAELGIAASVSFVGNVPHDRYRELLAGAQIGLQPSRTAPDGDTEGGAPTVLLEMQASGMPVLASRHADIPTVVADPDALVDEEDHEALAAALIRTAERDAEQWRARAERARQETLARHSAPRIAALVEDIYDRVREGSPPRRSAAGRSKARALHLGDRALHSLRGRVARVNEEPVFVLGQVKSGTTAIAAMLAERTGSSVTLDVPALFGSGFMPLARGEVGVRDFARANRLDFSRDIIKQASLTWIYPQLREAFPRARFVMIIRDPRENVRSILNRLDLPGDQEALSAEQIDSAPEAWRWFLQAPDELGIEASSYIELLASGWSAAADVYLEHGTEMRLVKYEEFNADKVGSVTRCAQDVDLEPVNDISHLLDVQYQSRGDREIGWPEFFGERNLRAIDERCNAQMARLGYRPWQPSAADGREP